MSGDELKTGIRSWNEAATGKKKERHRQNNNTKCIEHNSRYGQPSDRFHHLLHPRWLLTQSSTALTAFVYRKATVTGLFIYNISDIALYRRWHVSICPFSLGFSIISNGSLCFPFFFSVVRQFRPRELPECSRKDVVHPCVGAQRHDGGGGG